MTENALKLKLLVYGIAALVIGIPAFFIARDLLTSVEVGECARPSASSDGGFDMTETDCTSADASYRLVKLEQRRSCPSGDYLTQTERKAGRSGGSKQFCYVLNVREGDCLKRSEAFHERVACGAGATQRVSKVSAGDDRALCGGAEARTYPDPATTICLENV
ncbi:hypothetical protein [Lentzea sp. NPDC060358]|uniref:hypothetical protein n=1 Tax=Lentzea sp. NPDC060358 TaxID=3347103 RepID=UPI0036660618